jgi:protocadherin Fat 1/2/3
MNRKTVSAYLIGIITVFSVPQVSSLEIIEGDPDAHFRVRPGSEAGEFNIEVLRLLDREVAPAGYNLTLKATDSGVPPRWVLIFYCLPFVLAQGSAICFGPEITLPTALPLRK